MGLSAVCFCDCERCLAAMREAEAADGTLPEEREATKAGVEGRSRG